jgi:hypothetical protein
MDTRTPDDRMDERLRAAGDRLRATAPGSEDTERSLTAVAGPAGWRRRGWVGPAVVVAAAAATIGVLVITGGPERADEQVPAESPPVTAAPTTLPPSVVDDLPPVLSAAVLGCPGTVGEILAAADPTLDPVNALACSGDEALLLSGDVVVSLRRGADGTWSEVQRESSDCRPTNCAVSFDVLPVPAESLLVRDLGDLDPVDVTRRVRRQGDLVQVSEPEQWARSLGARLADGQDPAPTVNVEVVDGTDIFLITLSGLGDDSIGEVTYVVWYDPSPPVPTVERAFLISRCSRGVAVDEAGQPMDLCI